MNAALWLAQFDVSAWARSPMTWGIFAAAFGLALAIPRTTRLRRTAGQVIFLVSLGLVAASAKPLGLLPEAIIFWLLAGVTLASAAAAVSMQSAVYCAVWFAMSLLGAAGLFFYQGAQFLGVATIVVYAGAIVVTFLFVVMLAQPDGLSSADRISWGWYPRVLSPLAGAVAVSLLTAVLPSAIGGGAASQDEVLHSAHMARFGSELFGPHLVSVELAGTLLLVALVGAIAILMHGVESNAERPSP